MKMKMKDRSHRYDINKPTSRHELKHSKYKKCLSMMMLICIKQHPSNIWSSIHEKVKQHWRWVEKSIAYKKKRKINQTPRMKVLKNKMVPQNVVVKSKMCFSYKNGNTVIVRLRIRPLIFMRLTAERDNLIWLYRWSLPNAWPPI